MEVREWLRSHWNDIKGNAKWELTKLVAKGIGIVLVSLFGAWTVRRVTALTHFWTTAQQQTVLLIFVIAWLVKEETTTPSSLLPSPPPLSPITALGYKDILNNAITEYSLRLPSAERVHGDADLSIDIKEVLFTRTGGGLLAGTGKDVIVFRIAVTNRGHDEPAAAKWNLTVRIGKTKNDTDATMSIPGNWVVRRETSYVSTQDEAMIDIVAASQTSEFRRGIPKIGWIAFTMYSEHGAVAPYNADYAITITDSLGNKHVGILAATRYVAKGTIAVVDANKVAT